MSTDLAAELWILRHDGAAAGRISSLDQAGQPLTVELTDELAARGLVVLPRGARANSALSRAGAVIQRVASLERVVLGCVQDVLVLDAPDEWHDVSLSEPRWPHLIFVSIPGADPVGDLRLAEAVVHEAMHLNLTLAEGLAPLVSEDTQLYSPWRLGARPARGVLHGVYVFATLLRFFERLERHGGFTPEQYEHLKRRSEDILQECREVQRDQLLASLTDAGRTLIRRVYDYVDRQSAKLAGK